MFKAEIIDSMRYWTKKIKLHTDAYLMWLSYLEKSIEFHLGDFDSFSSFTKTILCDADFNKNPLPHDSTLLTFSSNKSKLAFLGVHDNYSKVTMSIPFCEFLREQNNKWFLTYPAHHVFEHDTNMTHISTFDNKEPSPRIIKELDFCCATLIVLNKLLSCKNIVNQKINASKKANRKLKSKGHTPSYDYHVLNVSIPSQKRTIIVGEKTPSDQHNRVHLCRGHFKEYTEANPLFGKCTGTYWWQPSLRGQNTDGFIDKDYKVKI
jgi:hypothetical protein